MQDSPVILEWVRQGRDEGRVEGTCASLIRVGQWKLGHVSESTRAKLESITDLERLERMMDRLRDVETWTELLAIP